MMQYLEIVDEPVTFFDIIRKVGCEGCDIYYEGHLAALPEFDPVDDSDKLLEKELIEKWNRRHEGNELDGSGI